MHGTNVMTIFVFWGSLL